MMLYFFSFLQTALSINLASSDLFDNSWSVTGWSAITSGGTTTSPYNQISNQCNNQNMLILGAGYLTYQKTYTITDYEFYQLFIELDVYFYTFTQTTINIIVNAQNIYSQQFTSSILALNNVCNTGTDSQYTIFQGFYTTQQSLIVQIQYIQNTINANSYAGIKNLNIYSNGIPLIGGCPMSTPLNSNGVCGATCTTLNPYLTGQYWNQCGSGTNTSSAIRFNLLTNANNFQMNNAPTTQEQTYLYFTGAVYMLTNSNIYTSSIMHNSLFTTLYKSTDIYYYYSVSAVGATNAFQFILVFYVFGDWDDGSYVSFYVSGSTQYQNSMITISKQQGQYYSSTQSVFYKTNVTQSGVNIQARKTLLALSGRYFAVAVRLCVIQFLSGSTASYGFGNIVTHKALSDPNFAFPTNTDIYGLPYTCLNGLFAYNGTCVSSCPVYSFTSTTNKNCTDYSASESSIYNSAIPISSNAYGTYIIKQFYQNNFLQTDIDSLFQTKPPTSKNYLNGESFSFIQSKKVLGGYNSWGYGTYQAQFTNLKAHFQVRFFFTLYLIDGWQVGDSFTYQVDGVVVDTYTKSPSQQYQGLSTQDSIYVISGRKVSHGSSTLTISFNCNVAYQDSSKASCGIQNLFVLIDQNVNILCPLTTQYFSYTTQNCETCTTSPCQLFPANTITAKCSIGCLTCTSSTVCTACDTSNGYLLSGNACICQSNYIMISSICQSNYFMNLECYYQCTTCSGTASNLCSSCDATRTLTSNSCPCNSNYYDVQSVTACSLITTTCHYSCSTCYGLAYNQCITCPASSYRTFQSSSNTCPCDATYSDNGVALCVSSASFTCDTTCLTCSAAGSTNCTSCDSTKNRSTLTSGQCLCDSGFNDVLNPGNACVANYTPCHYSCNTCYGSSDTNCLSCSSANFRTISSNQCPCNNGYLDITLSQCALNYSPCHYSCLTCFGASSTQCLTCPSTRDLNVVTLGSQSSCNCQAGTYNNSVATCVTCDSTCQTCTGAGSNSCSSCDSTKHRTLSGTTCPCSTGYNDILNPGNPCVLNYSPCHQNCLTCFDQFNINCITCDGSNNRVLSSSQCDCDTNYSDIGQAACLLNYTPCHYSCSTCYGPDDNQCSTCEAGRTINVVTLGVESSCPCSSSSYVSGQSCLACHPSCLTCDGSTSANCTDCDSLANRAIQGNTCPCMLSHNELLNPGTCVPNLTTCHNTCYQCFGSANNQCIECKENRYLTSNTCPCSSGFNEVVNPGTCVLNYTPCHQQCDTCYGPLSSNCLSCDPTTYRIYNSGTFTCPCDVGYIDIGMFYCVLPYSPCDPSCLTCFGDQIDQCITCSSTRTLNIVSPGNQVCGCKPKYYEVVGDSDCTACYYTCASCNGNTDVNCQSCNANRVLTTNSCPCITNYNDLNGTLSDCQLNYSPCHLSCQTCFGGSANQCLDCPSGSLRTYNNTAYTCDCPAGYDGSSTNCTYICHATCLTCDGPNSTDCLTCDTAVRQLQSTSCICNNGMNDKLNPPNCVTNYTPCYASFILTCYGAASNQALSCDSSVNRTLNVNICSCASGYYEISATHTCAQCNPSCKTCNWNTNSSCLTCDTTKNRVAVIVSNQCPCQTNFNDKLNIDQACVADLTTCHYSCQTCFGSANNQCLTCPTSSFRTIDDNECPCDSNYGDAGTAQCVLCDPTCKTCNGASNNNCLSCEPSINRTLSGSTCVCASGYNSLVIVGSCTLNYTPCHYRCDTCFGASANQCVSCGSTYHRVYQVNHTCPCETNYIEQNSQQTCVQLYSPCHFSCNQCYAATMNDCANCSPTSNRTFVGGKCLCNNGYNDALNQQICQLNYTPCDSTCVTCFGGLATQCLTCTAPLSINGNVCQCPTVSDIYLNGACHTLVTPCHISCLTCIDNTNNGCYQCALNREFQSSGPNQVCNCIDGYFEDSNNSNTCTQCHYSCLTCQTTIRNCQSCSAQQHRELLNNSCPCIQNYQEVNQICISCTNTDCLTCDSQQNCLTCVSEIKQVSNGLCICIDGYYQQGSSCFICDQTCLTCNGAGNTKCLSCDSSKNRVLNFGVCGCFTGYQENSNRQCIDCQSQEGQLLFQCQYKNPSDGVWNYGEQCDDGNNDPRDGCDNQKVINNYSCINIINEPSICYKCPDNCIKCIYIDDQVICNSCQDTYYNAKLSCIQCNDSQCKYCNSPSQCSVCKNDIIPQNGKCFICQNGYYQVGYTCESECGDGIKTLDEECDDGNLQSGDGCSISCRIEENFVCQTSNNLSSCKINTPPKLQITPVAMRQTNLKRFNIASTQNVSQQNVSLEIITNQSEYITLQYEVQNQSDDQVVGPLQIDVNLTFSQTFSYLDITFVVHGLLNNEFNQNVSSRQLQAPVKDVQLLTNQEKQISSQVAQMGQGSVITFACVSASQLLLGGIQQFIQFLNMIQQLQYIQYINIQFPPNLAEFLNIFNGFTMMPLVKVAYLNNLFAILGTDSFTYVQPSAQFQANGINAYFLENIQGFVMACLSGYLLNQVFKGLINIIQYIKMSFENRKFKFMKQIYNTIKKLQRFLINSCDLFDKYGMIQLTLASSFDLQFAILMQLSVQNYDDANLTINTLLAYGFLTFYGLIVVKCSKFKDEELNDKVIWQSTFSSIKMIEASVFMFSIINLQDFPQCQVIIISLSSLTVAIYTFAFRPLRDTFNNYKLIIQELSLFITNISFVGYIYFPTDINQVYLGWFHIGSYGAMIFCNLVIETYSNASILKSMFQARQKANKTQRTDSQVLIT